MLSISPETLNDRFLRAVVGNVPPEHLAGQLGVPVTRIQRLMVRYRLNWSAGRYLHHLATPEPVPTAEPEEPDEVQARARVEILPGRVRFPDGRMLRVRYAEHPPAVMDVHPGPMPPPPQTVSAIGCSLA